MWLFTYRNSNIQQTSSDYSKLFLIVCALNFSLYHYSLCMLIYFLYVCPQNTTMHIQNLHSLYHLLIICDVLSRMHRATGLMCPWYYLVCCYDIFDSPFISIACKMLFFCTSHNSGYCTCVTICMIVPIYTYSHSLTLALYPGRL